MARKLVIFFLVGALVGTVVATSIMSQYLPWDYTPRTGQPLCNCAEVATDTIAALVKTQLTGAAIGGAVFAILGAIFLLSLKKRGQPPAAVPPAGPPVEAPPGS